MAGARIYLIVSGPPGSGKSTLAPQIAAHFGLPLIAKDTIKDALMTHVPPRDIEASRDLGRAAVAIMYAVAAEAPRGAVIESVFYRSCALPDLRALPGRLVEVFCRCDPQTGLARYRARSGTRHAGHFDADRTTDEIQDPEVSQPVAGGWPVVEVETDAPTDVDTLLRTIESRLAAS